MFISGFMIGIYAVVALLAALSTLIEMRASNGGNTLYGTLGLVACAFWPITLMMVVLAAQRGAHSA